MAASSAEEAVRNYLTALKDPESLRDEDTVESFRAQIESTTDELERLQLRQQLHDAENPSLDGFEEEFVTHARAWAEEHGVGAQAFSEEGVPDGVLRRAGLSTGRRGGRRGRRTSTRSRVTADEVRAAIPKGTFTTKTLQEKSGASPAVVRKVIAEEEESGRVTNRGPDPDHQGPGRAPTLYKRAG